MSISIEAHDRICQDLHQQIRSLIVENEKLRAALAEPVQEPLHLRQQRMAAPFWQSECRGWPPLSWWL
jgi:hypothetical protein